MFNGDSRNKFNWVGIVIALLGVAVGYGTLKSEVSANRNDIISLRAEVYEAKTNAGASAAGASLQAQINEISRRLDRIERQNDEILRRLPRSP